MGGVRGVRGVGFVEELVLVLGQRWRDGTLLDRAFVEVTGLLWGEVAIQRQNRDAEVCKYDITCISGCRVT